MRFMEKVPDGGKGSGVTAYYLIEIKSLFSIALLYFAPGTREAFHSHAFSAVTLWLKGKVLEHLLGNPDPPKMYQGGKFKYTSHYTFHQIEAIVPTWALSFRGPWQDKWEEYRLNNKPGERFVTLTHGRKEVM